jgi:hypothetical protein
MEKRGPQDVESAVVFHEHQGRKKEALLMNRNLRDRLSGLIFIGAAVIWASLSPALTPPAQADPQADADFLDAVYPIAHPQVSSQTLVQLGHQACGVRRAGGGTGDAKVAITKTLWTQGVMSSNAEVGSLVHAAVDTLCPEVGYP